MTDARQLDPIASRLPGSERQAPDMAGACAAQTTAGVCGESYDWSERFINEMRADVARHRIRAAHVRPVDVKANAVSEVYKRLGLALETQNPAYFIDVAKFAMWAWISRTPKEAANAT